MDTGKLKKFAQSARRTLMEQTAIKLGQVLTNGSAARREQPKAVKELEGQIATHGKEQVIERVAYTWFNRLSALRFMDANGLNRVRAVSPAQDQTRPEILSEAAAGVVDDDIVPERIREDVAALLEGRTPSRDPQGEAYRLLLVAVCNHWHAAMPFMFEKIADFTELLMPEGLLAPDSVLAEMREVMTDEACQDVEIIGWLYQFYISEKKDQVFAGLKKNVKITPENIPAATQLFTPHWIVRYLVENSLGRLWLLNRPGSKLAGRMDYYIASEEAEMDFLHVSKPEDIRICDPACGSGHMLTYAFDLLHAIYEEEGYEASEIPVLILKHNLTGIEIDDRAGALAAFALTMKAAAKLGRRRFLRIEVKPAIIVLQNVAFTPAEMQDVAAVVGKDLFTDALRETLMQFEQAKNFGSLIVPKLRDPAETLRVVEARDFGSDLLLKEVQARLVSVLRMGEALSPKYHVVVANPPYAGSRGLNDTLSSWLQVNYPRGKADMFSAFIERGFGLSISDGFVSMVTMESWMFLSSYLNFRSWLLSNGTLNTLLHMPYLGKGGTSMGISFGTAAFVLRKNYDPASKGEYCCVRYFETDDFGIPLEFPPKNERRTQASTEDFSKIPGSPIAYWVSDGVLKAFEEGKRLDELATTRKGMVTARNEVYVRDWHEVSSNKSGLDKLKEREAAKASGLKWFSYLKGGGFKKWYGNKFDLVNWQDDGHALQTTMHPKENRVWATNFNLDYIFKSNVNWGAVTSAEFSARLSFGGELFDAGGSACFPEGCAPEVIVALLNSKITGSLLKALNPTLNFQAGNIASIPIASDLKEAEIEANTKSCISATKSDWDAYETSWDFTTLPLLQPHHRAETLEDTYTALRTHWQGMTSEIQRLEEENNRIFIEAYGLQDELIPEVPFEEITLTCNPAYRYGVKATEEDRETRLRADTMAEFLSYAVGCMFGRYSLDAPGLILANQGETLADYLARVPEPSFLPDEDNVVPVLDADWFPDDIVNRFRKFLRVTFGEAHFRENLAFIEAQIGDIRKYFTRNFYDDHVKRYKKRPIYWMFSSPKGSFNALIYMHRYRPDTVSIVLNDYLREFRNKLIGHRKQLEAASISGEASQGEKTRALKEIEKLGRVIEELDDYERNTLYPLATKQIEIDLDDGVKVNYAKFGRALATIKGLGDAED